MTQEEKAKVIELKNVGMSYSDIAKATKLNPNSIASFLRRTKDKKSVIVQGKCKYCGSKLFSDKQKSFCSIKCKNAWWNLRRKQKAYSNQFISRCLFCGKEISLYGNPRKKYCSHDCYVSHRFGKVGGQRD